MLYLLNLCNLVPKIGGIECCVFRNVPEYCHPLCQKSKKKGAGFRSVNVKINIELPSVKQCVEHMEAITHCSGYESAGIF